MDLWAHVTDFLPPTPPSLILPSKQASALSRHVIVASERCIELYPPPTIRLDVHRAHAEMKHM